MRSRPKSCLPILAVLAAPLLSAAVHGQAGAAAPPAAAAAAPPAGTTGEAAAAHAATAQAPAAAAPGGPVLTLDAIEHLAQERAARPYRVRAGPLPEALARLNYDQYREIRYRRTSALWYGTALFEVQFFHRGFNYDRRISVYEVTGAGVRPVAYSPALFEFGPHVPRMRLPANLGFAGLRVHYPLNRPAYKDEVIAFLGASYFRVLARGQTYGLSARGLAIDTAASSGEEFPYFTDFWLLRPAAQQRSLTIFALLDSPGVTGAYQFDIHPGAVTQVQVSARLQARRPVGKLGIAPLTSMFLYGENSRPRHFDDVRPEVHDSDGLMMQSGTGEWLWRPLANPRQLRVNRFMDEHPHGFGLVQRDRDFDHYLDAAQRYELRPSYWIEPLGDWGKGGIELVEIPSEEEIHDNVVAYWVPEATLQPGKTSSVSYLLSAWSRSPSWPPGGRVLATRTGRVLKGTNVVAGARAVSVDFAGGELDGLDATQPVHAQTSIAGAELQETTVQRLPNGTWRVTLQLKPAGDKPVELRCYLTLYGEALTETWTTQMTAGS